MNATKVNAGPAESNGKLLLGIWRDSLHVTCGLTACTPGSAPGPTLSNEYGKTLPFYFLPFTRKRSLLYFGRDFSGWYNVVKIIKIVATRWYVLKLKCTKFDFGWGSAPQVPYVDLSGRLQRGREGEVRKRKGPKGRRRKWVRGEVEAEGVDIAWPDLRDATAAASGPVGS